MNFNLIYDKAVERKGSEEDLLQRLPTIKTTKELESISDDRYLSAMTKGIFRAGFVWKVIETKWPGFEAAFEDFNPKYIAKYDIEDLDRLVSDKKIVRNLQKISATVENAKFVIEKSNEYGSFGKFIAQWPSEDIITLWDIHKREGSRLGGLTGPYYLRECGKDTFLLTQDVSRVMHDIGVIDTPKPTSKKALKAVQECFNTWHQETGRTYSELSRIVACSTGENY